MNVNAAIHTVYLPHVLLVQPVVYPDPQNLHCVSKKRTNFETV